MKTWMYGTEIETKEHIPQIQVTGWGEPEEYRISCHCGWRGLTVDTWPVDQMNLLEPDKTFVETWGLGLYNQLQDRVSGNRDTAMVQILHHLGYDPQADYVRANEAFEAAVEAFKNVQGYSETENSLRQLKKDAEELAEHKIRIHAWENEPLPKIVEVSPEAKKSYLETVIGY